MHLTYHKLATWKHSLAWRYRATAANCQHACFSIFEVRLVLASKEKERNVSISFDWQNLTLEVYNNGKQTNLTARNTTTDDIGASLSQSAMKPGKRTSLTYSVIHIGNKKDKLGTSHFYLPWDARTLLYTVFSCAAFCCPFCHCADNFLRCLLRAASCSRQPRMYALNLNLFKCKKQKICFWPHACRYILATF